MTCCCSTIAAASERQFGRKRAAADLAQYRAKGPGQTARLLLTGLSDSGAARGGLLDVGSGAGALAFELLKQGMTSAVGVDLSPAYVAAASSEAARLGRSESARFLCGDFVEFANQLSPAEVVALDRVICCYPEAERLLGESLRLASRYFALSYPRDVWYVRAWVRLENAVRRIARNPFRTFVHSAARMEQTIRRTGFERVSRRQTGTWRADVYMRS